VDEELEAALLTYKQQKAARWGAERFADELRRRDEAEEARPVWTSEVLAPPVEASVEAQVVDGDPTPFRPEPPRVGFDPRFVVEPADPEPEDLEELESTPASQPSVAAEIDVAVGAVEAFELVSEAHEAIETEDAVEVEAEPELEPEVEAQSEPEPEPEIEAEPELEPESERLAPPVELPRFVPDAAWAAGSRAGKLERLPAALRNPHVPRPPAPDPEPVARARRRWRSKHAAPEPVKTPAITQAEWARMSPGARRLYGLDEAPGARRAG
jgi:hypothetical protein